MASRTFLHKDCDKEVFGPLLSRFPNHIWVGTGSHIFTTSTMEELTGSADYPRERLHDTEMTTAELYEYVCTRIGTDGYLGAIETTQAQAGAMQTYKNSLDEVTE